MQLWRLLEDRTCWAGVASEWKRWLGCDPSVIARWLRPREELARSILDAEGRWLRIVEHGDDDVVGIDDDAGTSVAVAHEARVVHELDVSLLLRDIAATIGVDGAAEDLGRRTWLLGHLAPTAARGSPAVLAVAQSREDLLSAAGTVAARVREPFFLMTPTARMLCEPVRTLLRERESVHMSLESLLRIDHQGIALSVPIAEAFRGLPAAPSLPTPSVPPPIPAPRSGATTDELQVQVARLKAIERDCLTAVFEKGIIGPDAVNPPDQSTVADWAGYPWDATLKAALSTLVKVDMLGNGRHHGKRGGYFVTDRGVAAAEILAKS